MNRYRILCGVLLPAAIGLVGASPVANALLLRSVRGAVATAASFSKPGNNGTVNCDTFCEGNWPGGTGACLGAVRTDTNVPIGCGEVAGVLRAGQVICTCSNRFANAAARDAAANASNIQVASAVAPAAMSVVNQSVGDAIGLKLTATAEATLEWPSKSDKPGLTDLSASIKADIAALKKKITEKLKDVCGDVLGGLLGGAVDNLLFLDSLEAKLSGGLSGVNLSGQVNLTFCGKKFSFEWDTSSLVKTALNAAMGIKDMVWSCVSGPFGAILNGLKDAAKATKEAFEKAAGAVAKFFSDAFNSAKKFITELFTGRPSAAEMNRWAELMGANAEDVFITNAKLRTSEYIKSITMPLDVLSHAARREILRESWFKFWMDLMLAERDRIRDACSYSLDYFHKDEGIERSHAIALCHANAFWAEGTKVGTAQKPNKQGHQELQGYLSARYDGLVDPAGEEGRLISQGGSTYLILDGKLRRISDTVVAKITRPGRTYSGTIPPRYLTDAPAIPEEAYLAKNRHVATGWDGQPTFEDWRWVMDTTGFKTGWYYPAPYFAQYWWERDYWGDGNRWLGFTDTNGPQSSKILSSRVYLVIDGKKRWITSRRVWDKYQFVTPAKATSDSDLDKIPDGDPLL